MPTPARSHVRPLLGSAALHVLFLVILAAAALRWRADPPPEQLAIEGNIVRYEDLPASVRDGRPLEEPATEPVSEVPPLPEPPAPEPEPEPVIDVPAPEPVPVEASAAEANRQAEDAQRAAEVLRREQVAEQRAAGDAAAAQKKLAEDEARRKADAKSKAELEVQQAKEQAARDAKRKAEREAELRRALENEEAGAAIAQSGVMDEYRVLLIQTIERNWIRPATARAGLECTLYVNQATGGTVLDVTIGDCNGDQAVRESVSNAVYRSSPLPAPRDARAFERRLVIVFKPTE